MTLLSIEVMVRQCTDQVKAGLRPFVEHEMRKVYGQDWETRAGCQFVAGAPHWDLQALLKTILDNWQAVFDKSLPRTARNLVFELKDWRNQVAHEHNLTLEDTARLLDTAARLLKIVGAPQASNVKILRLKALQAVIADVENPRGKAQTGRGLEKIARREPALASLASNLPVRQIHVAGAPSRQSCVAHLSVKLGADLTRRMGCCAFSADGDYGVCCLVSKEYAGKRFWWNLRERQLRDLTAARSAFIAFACGSSDAIILISLKDFTVWLPTFNPKPGDDGQGWHIHILRDTGNWWLLQAGRDNRVNITQYVI